MLELPLYNFRGFRYSYRDNHLISVSIIVSLPVNLTKA